MDNIKLPDITNNNNINNNSNNVNSVDNINPDSNSSFVVDDLFGSPEHYNYQPLIVDTPTEANIILDSILAKAISIDASDVFIHPNMPISYMVLSQIRKDYTFGKPTPEMILKIQDAIITYVEEDTFLKTMELDISYTIRNGKHKGRRFRVSIGRSFKNTFMVFRTISENIPTPENLLIPKQITHWFNRPNGLILINGPVGSGKSTTIASILTHIIGQTPKHVVTIEKPIEYQFPNTGQALFTQREVEKDTLTFYSGLKSALRQAPDIIFVGEVRDRQEIDTLLSASEIGRLSLSTIHASNCIKVVSRILTLYPQTEHSRILSNIAEHTIGLVNQKLLLHVDGKKRIPIHEILEFTPQVKQLVSNNNITGLYEYMIENQLTFEHKLIEKYLQKQISLMEAKKHANDPHLFDKLLENTQNSL